MANKSVFASAVGKLLPRPDSRNREGALAFEYTPEHKLAQFAVTGCFNGTFYAEAREQLAAVGGGGTDCSAPLARQNRDRAAVGLAVIVSDN